MTVKFGFFSGDVNWKKYGGSFVSMKSYSNGEFDYWFVIDVRNPEEDTGEEYEYTYSADLSVVAPSLVSSEEITRMFEYLGCNNSERYTTDERTLAGFLAEYGVGKTPVKHIEGNNIRKIMQELRKEAQMCEMLFGFYMDRPVNRIGATGWDCLHGDLMAGIYYDRSA